jgi:uridine nucleosidase
MAKKIWLDCDPGHDDAMAILMAVQCPDVELLGVSTVHGNTSLECTRITASRCLNAFGASPDIKVHAGAARPLLRPTRADPQIHGPNGLGGVEGLPSTEDEAVRIRVEDSKHLRAIDGIANAIQKLAPEEKLTLVATGPLTNMALFLSIYPDLLPRIEQICFMGGGVGVGNRSSVAEFNILCDPEAAQIVLNAEIPKVMIPLNVTHTAIFTRERFGRLLTGGPSYADKTSPVIAVTPLRHTLSTLMSFFTNAYREVFGFMDGPPLHDAMTIAYVSKPELFKTKRYRVDVELGTGHAVGETIVDVWNYRQTDDTWGPGGKNCLVAESADIPGCFEVLFDAVNRSDLVSPLNNRTGTVS